MKCPNCGFEFSIEEAINWTEIDADYEDAEGQEFICPECGEPIWIPSWEIEAFLIGEEVESGNEV